VPVTIKGAYNIMEANGGLNEPAKGQALLCAILELHKVKPDPPHLPGFSCSI